VTSLGREVSVRNLQVLISSIVLFVDGIFSGFPTSVTAALRDRRDEVTPVIMDELQRMLDMHVWHGVRTRDLSKKQRREIIPSKMFLKEKYLASGVFEQFKGRLVAGGHQQDKGLYENSSSPTVATSSVLAIAAIAAAENRKGIANDIGVHSSTLTWPRLESRYT
jgi:hypothetical protein